MSNRRFILTDHHLLLLFIVFHFTIWTVMSTLTRNSLPADTLESIAWGLQWQFGYNKHPFLAPWLAASVVNLSGNVGLAVYALGQLSMALCFYGVWLIAKKLLPTRLAVLSVLMLATIWYYSLLGPKFDPNSLMMPMWVWLALAFYQALEKQHSRYWLLTGVLAGLCLLTKYQSVIILACCFLYAVIYQRQVFATKGPYVAIAIMMVVFSPNLWWLSQHDFIPLNYAGDRLAEAQTSNWLAHIREPAAFLWHQLATLALFIIVALSFRFYPKQPWSVQTWQMRWITFFALGPLCLTLLISVITGGYLYPKWSAPYYSLLGIWCLLILRPQLSDRQFYRCYGFILMVSLLLVIARSVYLVYLPHWAKKHDVDAYFPYQAIATHVSQLWQQRYHTPLPYLVGTHYLVAGVSDYALDKPIPYFDADIKQSEWVNEQHLKQQGAIFIWQHGQPAEISQRFPSLVKLQSVEFKRPHQSPLNIDIALLPPA